LAGGIGGLSRRRGGMRPGPGWDAFVSTTTLAVKGHGMIRTFALVVTVLCAVTMNPSTVVAQQGSAAPRGLTPDTQKKLVESLNKAEAYLRQQQAADGTWEKHPGITGVATAAILQQPGKPKAGQVAAVSKSLDYLVGLAKPDGGIYDSTIPHYITAVSASALAAGGRPQDRPVLLRAGRYLATNMLDEGEGVNKNEFWYGGMGYGNTTRADGRRADIISLEYALRAMRDAELPENDAAWQKAITFLQRTQNNSETNDQKWAANDGGFVYYPGFTYHTDGGTKSYGSSTYAGVLSYTWAHVKKEDARVKAVSKWIRDTYTVDENPGMGQKTVYYYYMVFAKALQALGEPVITDARGRTHNWREELGRKLVSLQHPEGFWVNEVKDEMQDNKVLVTAFTMSAVQAILK
jgi:squalene-hopene/tetraprenyl-beta-curcumene cyclase